MLKITNKWARHILFNYYIKFFFFFSSSNSCKCLLFSTQPHLTENCIFFFYFLPHRGSEGGSWGSYGWSVCAQPVWKGRRLHHGRNWQDLQEGKRHEERSACCGSLFLSQWCFSAVLVKASELSTWLCFSLQQVSLFLPVCRWTIAFAISLLWRATRTSLWKTGTLSKCKQMRTCLDMLVYLVCIPLSINLFFFQTYSCLSFL